MNDDLLISIGADLSSYNTSLDRAEKTFKSTLNTINSFSNSNKIDIGLNLAQFIDGKEKVKNEYQKLKNEIMNNALELVPNVDNSDIEKYTDKYLKEIKDTEEAVQTFRVKQAKETGILIDKEQEKARAAELSDLKRHIMKRNAIEKNRKDVLSSLAAQKREELAKEAQLEAVKQKKLMSIAIRSKHETYKRLLKIKHITDRKEEAAEIKKMMGMNHKELRKYEEKERRKTAIYKRQAAKRNIDSAVGRGFLDSVKVVAKYGAISQVLYGIQNAFRDVIAESLRFNQSIYTLQAVLNKNKMEASQLANEIVKIGKTYGGTFADIEKGMLTLGRAGIDGTRQLTQATKVLAQLALITGDSMEEGAAAMSTLLNVYPELRNEVDLLGDRMGYVANETRLGIADFSTISNYALTTAKSLNFTSDAYLALNGAMSKIGLNASTIGTNIRRIKKITDDDSAAMQEFFRVLGVSQKEFADNMRKDSEKELVRFSKALNKLSQDSDRYSRATKALNIQVKGTIDNFAQIGKQNYMEEMLNGIKDETYNLEEQTRTATVGMVKAWETVRNTIISLFDGKANELFDEYFNRDNADAFRKSIEDMVVSFNEWYDTIVKVVEIGFYAMIVRWIAGFVSLTTGVTALSAATLLLNSRLLLLAKNPAFLAIIGVGALGAGIATFAKTTYDYADKLQNPDPLDEEQMLAMQQAFAGQGTAYEELTKLHEEYSEAIITTEKQLKMLADTGNLNGQTSENLNNKLTELKSNVKEVSDVIASQGNTLLPENVLGNEFDVENILTSYDSMVEYGDEMVANTNKIQEKQRQLIIESEKANGTYDKRKWLLKDIERLTTDIAVAEAIIASEGGSEGNVLALLNKQIQLEKTRQALRKEEASGGGRVGSAERAKINSLLQEVKLKGIIAEIDALSQGRLLTETEQFQMKLDLADAEVMAMALAYQEAEKLATTDKGRLALKRAEVKLFEALRKQMKLVNKDAKKFANEMEKVGASFSDSLLDGDLKGAFKGLFKDITKVFTDPLKNAFSNLFGNSMQDLVGGFYDSLTGFIETWATEGIAAAMGVANANATASVANQASSGDPYSAWARMAAMAATMAAMGLITSFSGGGVSQAEIDAAKGRSEYDDDSLRNALEIFDDVQVPLLEVTNKMYRHIRNMDENFYAIARAFSAEASTAGIDLTGVNFVDTVSEGFLGFSSESISLIGTGLQFYVDSLEELMTLTIDGVKSYTTTLVEESSWWGLSSSTSIRETYKNLPQSIIDDMAASFVYGYETLMTAGVTLGLDQANLSEALLAAEVELDKIDFTGLSPDEVSDRLSQVFSTAFSGIIDQVEAFTPLIERYTQGTDDALETLTRIAVEYDQASFQFSLIGKTFTDAIIQTVETWTETTTTWVSSSDYFWGFLTGSWETVTETFTKITDSVYTAQMQILDIVESTGGLTNFQDAMSAFMTGFYSETEQLEFMVKTLEASFATLGVTMPDTNDEFRTLLETMDTSTEEGAYLYGQVLLLAESFAAMTDAAEDLEGALDFDFSGLLDAWTGDLSYLTTSQKLAYAEGFNALVGTSDELLDPIESARTAAELALQTTATKEDYIPYFERYADALEDEVTDATTWDVVTALGDLKDEVVILQDITQQSAIYGA